MSQPVIILASLMRLDGATGVQTHLREFIAHLQANRVAHVVANPFHFLTMPLLLGLIALRKVLEKVWPVAAVLVYRSGHASLLAVRLAWLMSRHADCVVYAQCPLSARVALMMRRRSTHKVALVVHFNVSQADEWIGKGMLQPGSWLDRRIRATEATVVKRVDGLIFVSAFMQQQMARVWPGIPAERCCVVSNFVKRPQDVSALPGMAGRDLINIGTLEPRKNQAFLLDVLKEAQTRGRRLSLTLVGDGPDRDMLRARVRDLGLQEQVMFTGFSARGRAHIPGHSLYVHAAHMESQGIVLLEAMSCGVAVVAPRVGGIPEVFDDGVQGCFWPLDDVRSACDILLSLLDDPPRLTQMSAAALQRFDAAFESGVVAARLHACLLSLAD